MSLDQTPLIGSGKHPPSYKATREKRNQEQEGPMRRTSFGESLRHMMQRSSLRDSLRRVMHHSFSNASCSVRDFGGTASVGDQVFNLVKNLVGAGVLALPSGVAAFANAPTAIIPATTYIILMGAIFAYFFLILGKTCKLTLAATYREAWEESMGDRGGTLVATVNMLKPALGNLAYSMILADTFKSLLQTAGLGVSRTQSLMLVTFLALLPLCLLKNLKVLSPFSLAGMLSMFLTAIAMGIRCFDSTYGENGKFVEDLPIEFQPEFGTIGASGAWTAHVLVFLCMVFEAFVAHYNAPRFFTELKNPTVGRFGAVVSYSFGISSLIYILVTAFGFLTFGASCDGYILNNYSVNDYLATISRVAVAISILFTYPLTFIGFRDGILDVFQVPMAKHTAGNINLLTLILLALVTILASLFTDLGMVNAVGGGSLVPFVVFVFPAFMYRAAIYDHQVAGPTREQLRELKLVFLLMYLGVILGAIGVILAVMGSMD